MTLCCSRPCCALREEGEEEDLRRWDAKKCPFLHARTHTYVYTQENTLLCFSDIHLCGQMTGSSQELVASRLGEGEEVLSDLAAYSGRGWQRVFRF